MPKRSSSTAATTDSLLKLVSAKDGHSAKAIEETRKRLRTMSKADLLQMSSGMLDLLSADSLAAKKRKKKEYQLDLPSESVLEVLGFLTRDELDAIQLSSRFFLETIVANETERLALRGIAQLEVTLCQSCSFSDNDCTNWLPTFEVTRSTSRNCLNEYACRRQINTYNEQGLEHFMRNSFCTKAFFDLSGDGKHEGSNRIVEDLTFYNSIIANLTLKSYEFPGISLDVIAAIKCEHLALLSVAPTGLTRAYFTELATLGVTSCGMSSGPCSSEGNEVQADAVVAFCLTSAASGVTRYVNTKWSAYCRIERTLLKEIYKQVADLDGKQKVDFKFCICLPAAADTNGFEHYHKNERFYVVDDLDNGVKMEIGLAADTSNGCMVCVYSSN